VQPPRFCVLSYVRLSPLPPPRMSDILTPGSPLQLQLDSSKHLMNKSKETFLNRLRMCSNAIFTLFFFSSYPSDVQCGGGATS
jgi:hypothetical protein